ncbi:MAG: RyR domain-containing protein, partial [Mycobacterium sp.]
IWDPTAGSEDPDGIDTADAVAMARAEHEDWCRYYREAGWRYGPVRDDTHKIHNGLVSWDSIESDPAALQRALTSLRATLSALGELGYRSRPVWQTFRRTGTVTAEQRSQPWSWTSASGQEMQAAAGDWAIQGPDGNTWSVRDDIFRSTHERLDGTHWHRSGVVQARKANPGEVVDTLEGPLTAQAGDWIVRGAAGELWPVRPDVFHHQYEGPLATEEVAR